MTTPAEEFLKQFPDEELDDELESYLTYEDVGSGKWAMLQHPLVYAVPYFAQMNHWHNNALKQKTKMLEDAWTYEEWTSYVYLHERPYRFQALSEIAEHVWENSGHARYWDLVRSVWTDSENIWQNEEGWADLLGRDQWHLMMDDDELAALNAMPELVTIYRGWQHDDRQWGWSWTLDKQRAEWFAQRFLLSDDPGYVTTVQAKRTDIVAYITSRGEQEIIIDPVVIEDSIISNEPTTRETR